VLAHISDLHFGRVERSVLEPLRRRLRELEPDLLLVSGDLTQRARARQFHEARAFLDTLPQPQLVVPGNHDVPLYNVLARFFRPLAAYRRIISGDLDPGFADEEIAVFGLNTARSFTWKAGGVSGTQLARLEKALSRLDRERTKVLVMHHLFPSLARYGFDVLIAGHGHTTRVEASTALLVHAGTATSHRTRTEPNSFNVLRIAPGRVVVEHHVLRNGAFVRSAAGAFKREGARWSRDGLA
jgi:3',5'-cyclic AMP phosphodiesterase CpdA